MRKTLLFFLILAILNAAICARSEEQTKLYPLPLAELDEVISNWLTDSGFAVDRSSVKTGKVELYAESENDNWQILLEQHSALATEVQAVLNAEDQSGHKSLGKLWDHISGYIKTTADDHMVEPEELDHDIPLAVLSRMESVVCIKAKTEGRDVQYSGFVVDDGGLILCTAHDLRECQDVTVSLHDGRKLRGHIVKMDAHKDLTLIRVCAKLDGHISLAGGRTLIDLGEKLYTIGCPVNINGSVFSGVMNGPQRRANGQVFWQVNMKIYPGSSGSPVFDVMGNLVAVVKGRYRGTDSVGFLIPLGTIIEFVGSL